MILYSGSRRSKVIHHVLKKDMKLGIAIPCYKYHIPVLKRCLDSIEAQSRKPDFVIVSCSSSVKEDIPAEYHTSYTFPLRIYTHRNRMNAAENRNFAATILHGLECDILSFFDCDDEMHPQRLKAIEHAFHSLEGCEFVMHSYLDKEDDLAKPFPLYETIEITMNMLERAPSGCAILRSNWQSLLHHSQVSIAKELFTKVRFREDKEFERKEDAFFCGDCLVHRPPNIYIANPLSKYYMEGSWK